ncbi:hypothetical protein ACFL0G_06485, partial [Candidatus Zixiibacteriota bacterium]
VWGGGGGGRGVMSWFDGDARRRSRWGSPFLLKLRELREFGELSELEKMDSSKNMIRGSRKGVAKLKSQI